ncbi:hypothetical protein AAFF_G00097280 [Aldrovandia affinis]|uniref:WW domain-containing protein n=1 Tax=Aldrovandia affinis TaxID=143900 RepID=A0AAD7WBL2_9TELE|nr:hypothetical protein AAFF_G00097280 [Aldrovandia affinis]
MAADLNPEWLSCLPSSWSYGVTRDGRVFFINEEAKSTTWLHPVTGEAVITGHRKTPDLPTGWEEGYTFEGARCFINDAVSLSRESRKQGCSPPKTREDEIAVQSFSRNVDKADLLRGKRLRETTGLISSFLPRPFWKGKGETMLVRAAQVKAIQIRQGERRLTARPAFIQREGVRAARVLCSSSHSEHGGLCETALTWSPGGRCGCHARRVAGGAGSLFLSGVEMAKAPPGTLVSLALGFHPGPCPVACDVPGCVTHQRGWAGNKLTAGAKTTAVRPTHLPRGLPPRDLTLAFPETQPADACVPHSDLTATSRSGTVAGQCCGAVCLLHKVLRSPVCCSALSQSPVLRVQEALVLFGALELDADVLSLAPLFVFGSPAVLPVTPRNGTVSTSTALETEFPKISTAGRISPQ